MHHYSEFPSFSSAFIDFSNLCRSNQIKVGLQANMEAMIIATKEIWGDEALFSYALKSIICTNPEEIEIFEDLYKKFWTRKSSLVKSKTTYKNQNVILQEPSSSLVMMGVGEDESDEDEKDAKNVSGANTKETLRKTDFAKVDQINSALLEELAEQLWKQMSLRLKRKYKKGKKGTINIQNTIRKNISNGGNFLELIKKQRKIQKFKLIVILDVSGSMDKYSFYLLKFIHVLRSNFKDIEAFVFSTTLIRITDFLDRKDLKETLILLSAYAHNWSSGTKIGLCLKKFNDQYSKKLLNRKTLTIILSDGLDTGKPSELQTQMNKIKLRTKKLVWLNPLKGMEGYQPIQRGMSVSLPSLNHFGAAHTIDSLLSLESILADA